MRSPPCPAPCLVAALLALGLGATSVHAEPVALVSPAGETASLATGGDSLEDVAVWTGGARTWLVLADAQLGPLVQGLDGGTADVRPDGVVDGIDVVADFELSGGQRPLVLVANRTTSSVWAYTLDPATGVLTEVPSSRFGIGTQPRALAAYRSPAGGVFLFTADAQGVIRQWALQEGGAAVSATQVRSLSVGVEVGDLVVDPLAEQVFAASPQVDGLTRFSAKADAGSELQSFGASVGPLSSVGLYALTGGQGYLLVSAPGTDVLTVLRRLDGALVGQLRITGNDAGVDPVEESRAVTASSVGAGPGLGAGLLVVQDRFDDTGQNLKLVRWEDVARAFTPALAPLLGAGGTLDGGGSDEEGGGGTVGGGPGLPVPEDDDGCTASAGVGPIAGGLALLLWGGATLRRRPRSRRMPPPGESN